MRKPTERSLSSSSRASTSSMSARLSASRSSAKLCPSVMVLASISRMSARRSRMSSNTCWRSMGVPRSTWVSAGTNGSCLRRSGRRAAYWRAHFVRLCTRKDAGHPLCEDAAMRAALLRQIPGKLEIDEVEVSSPGPHEVVIRTVAAGLCHSDLHFMEGKYPYPCPALLGHESAGIVEAVG